MGRLYSCRENNDLFSVDATNTFCTQFLILKIKPTYNSNVLFLFNSILLLNSNPTKKYAIYFLVCLPVGGG